MNKKWYAVYTKPRWEKKVSDLLTRKAVENYCPLNRVVRQWADRRKTIMEPLFNSYVFVNATDAEHVSIKNTDGVLSFVHWIGKPAVIRDEEIHELKRFLRDHDNIKLEKVTVNLNDKVVINSGPLMFMEGEVIEVKKKSIKVFLPSLGYAMTAEVKTEDIDILAPAIPNTILYNQNRKVV
jgi:transcription antitermination factor NusG